LAGYSQISAIVVGGRSLEGLIAIIIDHGGVQCRYALRSYRKREGSLNAPVKVAPLLRANQAVATLNALLCVLDTVWPLLMVERD